MESDSEENRSETCDGKCSNNLQMYKIKLE